MPRFTFIYHRLVPGASTSIGQQQYGARTVKSQLRNVKMVNGKKMVNCKNGKLVNGNLFTHVAPSSSENSFIRALAFQIDSSRWKRDNLLYLYSNLK